MPADLRDLTRNRGHLVKSLASGATITIDYYPVRITPRQLHRFQTLDTDTPFEELTPAQRAERQQIADEQTRALAECLISWDLSDNGVPIPATLEGLQDVDFAAQGVILGWLIEDQRLGKASANTAPDPAASPIAPSAASSTRMSPLPPQPPEWRQPSPNGTGFMPVPSGSE